MERGEEGAGPKTGFPVLRGDFPASSGLADSPNRPSGVCGAATRKSAHVQRYGPADLPPCPCRRDRNKPHNLHPARRNVRVRRRQHRSRDAAHPPGRHGLNGYLILPANAAGQKAEIHLAHTVGARAEPAELPAGLGDTEEIGTLEFRPSVALRETQAGIDPTELPRLLGNAMADGTWVSVTMRRPANKERRRYTTWLAHRLGTAMPTHHSMSPTAMVVSITAGAATRDEVRALLSQVTAGLPGFDLDTTVRFARPRNAAFYAGGAGAALSLAAALGLPHLPADVAALLPHAGAFTGLFFAAAAVFGLAFLAGLSGRLPSPDSRLRDRLDTGRFPAPASRLLAPARPRKEQIVRGHSKDSQGNRVPYERLVRAHDGEYPLHSRAFLVGPSVVVGTVSPHAGAISGVATTRARSTPPAMLQQIGPLLGMTDDGSAHLSAAAMLFGVAIVGRPGSGKSLLVRSLFGWHCLERVRPSGRAGYPGAHNTLIAFESKGDGAAKYVEWAHALGDQILVIDAADPSTPAIDLFAVPGDNAAKANFFTNAMKYTFGESAIGDRSLPTIVAVLTAAQAIDAAVLDSIDDRDELVLPHGKSPIFYAFHLLAGHSDKTAVTLAHGLRNLAVKLRERGTPNSDYELGYSAISSLFEDKTESVRRTFLEAPRNKFEQLLVLEDWWTPGRRKVTWEQVLNGHRSIVINTGSSATGVILDESQKQQLSSMLMFSLQNALMRYCSGWLEAGRSVSVFADELSLLAGTSPEIVGWIRDQGRSYGIRAILATQRPEQLAPSLRNNFLTYSTLVSFAQNDVTTAAEVAANVGGDWSTEDIQHIEPFQVVVRSEVEQRRQPAFIVKLPNFEADMANYPAAQGYAPAASGGPAW